MRTRVILTLLIVLTAGCGRGADAPPTGPAAVRVTVSRDYGAVVLSRHTTRAGESALNGLRRVSKVGTSYAGRFVESIDGLSGDRSAGTDWLYFINGIAPDSGAADVELHPGDHEWWDRRYWSDLVQTPVAIGAWPEPFVHGYGGHRHAVSVTGPSCASTIAGALRDAGADVVSGTADYRVEVETFAQALIAGYQPPVAPGDAVVLVVAGDTEASACAAAETLASHPSQIANTYAVALDAAGTVIAAGGRQ
jgi:hypothetical protein